MTHRTNAAGGKGSGLRGVNRLQEEAESFCESTQLDDRLHQILEQISSNIDDLSENQRRDLREIAELMAASGAGPIRAMTKPGQFELTASPDRMFLTLSVTAPIAGGKPVELAEVVEQIRARNITAGVMLPEIQKAVRAARNGEDVSNVVIVRGTPAVPGRDATITFWARRAPDRPLEEVAAAGLVGSNKAGWLCMKGDRIACYEPPKPGQDGYSADGETLKPPTPSDCGLDAGDNVACEDGQYVANISGMLSFDGQSLGVRPVLVLQRDVLRTNAPIDFEGEVIIRGSVRDGAFIKATGDIKISGNVEGAAIHSTGGDVNIEQGVVGRGVATVQAEGTIRASFAERAMLQAGVDIVLETGSMLSQLVAGNAITMVNGKGQLAGGSALAGVQVTVRQLGSPSELKTEVTVGFSKRAMNLIARIDRRRRDIDQQYQRCCEIIDSTMRLVRDPKQLDKPTLLTLTKLKQIRLVLQLRALRLKKRRDAVTSFAARDTTGKVDVLGEVMPGVTVQIGSAHLDTDGLTKRRQFIYDVQQSRVVVGPLK
jgi:uncharacterized protein (DUF342 family)